MEVTEIPQWITHEIRLTSNIPYPNPYTDISLSANFTNEAGQQIIRPAFWDGGNTWKIRFTSPDSTSKWTWKTQCSDQNNSGLHQQVGQLQATPYTGENTLLSHGLLKMSEKKRNVVHHDGHPFLVVGDTPWAIPFRATSEQVEIYAKRSPAKRI